MNPPDIPITKFPKMIVHIFSIIINPIPRIAKKEQIYKHNLLPFLRSLLEITAPIAVPNIGA
jgi:hypothetical protein